MTAINDGLTLENYYKLSDQRDAAYERAKPFEEELEKVVAQSKALREREAELVAKVEEAWGPNHLILKKQISRLARFFGKIPPRSEG